MNRVPEYPVDGSMPSEAWLFAQALIGKPISEIVDPQAASLAKRASLERLVQLAPRHLAELHRLHAAECEAQHNCEIREWAQSLLRPSIQNAHALKVLDMEVSQARESTEAFATSLLERKWDPSKHPRHGGPPNPGWWATTRGGGVGAKRRSTSDQDAPRQQAPATSGTTQPQTQLSHAIGRTDADHTSEEPEPKRAAAATNAAFSTSTGVPVHLAAQPAGHHWVPRSVYERLGLPDEIAKIFKLGTEVPFAYHHAYDTWNKVTHAEYIDSVRKLLIAWIEAKGGNLTKETAEEFLSWIATGKCDDATFAAKHKGAFGKVFKWRKGFLKSIVVAKAAADLDPKLTPAERKAIAQQVVNGSSTKPLSRRAAKAVRAIAAGGKALLRRAAGKVLPGLIFVSTAVAARRGWAGQGHTGSGAWGALNETAREMMMADVVETIVFPAVVDTVDGLTDLFAPGLNDRTRNRIVRRNGKLIDLDTGRIID